MFKNFKAELIGMAEDRGFSTSDINIDKSIISLSYNTLILGELSDSDERTKTLEEVDEFLNIVLNQRKQFSAAKACDMYLFLMAPPNSEDKAFWKTIAAEIERDDRLARKHVWLPDSECSNLNDFIEGTFMATPWSTGTEVSHALEFLTDELVLPKGWEEVLLNDEVDGRDLVNELIKLEGYL
jgi:hypothetical protein